MVDNMRCNFFFFFYEDNPIFQKTPSNQIFCYGLVTRPAGQPEKRTPLDYVDEGARESVTSEVKLRSGGRRLGVMAIAVRRHVATSTDGTTYGSHGIDLKWIPVGTVSHICRVKEGFTPSHESTLNGCLEI